jgi:hypothetical protein
MRSLTIDIWEEEQFQLMKEMGNAVSNKWWEFSLPIEQKINKNVDRETRNNFIFDKYLKRKWVDPFSSFLDKSDLLHSFLEACTQNNIPLIAKFFVDERLSLNQPIDFSLFQSDNKNNIFLNESGRTDNISNDPLSVSGNNRSGGDIIINLPSNPRKSGKSGNIKRTSPRYSSGVVLDLNVNNPNSPLYNKYLFIYFFIFFYFLFFIFYFFLFYFSVLQF